MAGRAGEFKTRAGFATREPDEETANDVRRHGELHEVSGDLTEAEVSARLVTGASFLIDGGLVQQVVERPAG